MIDRFDALHGVAIDVAVMAVIMPLDDHVTVRMAMDIDVSIGMTVAIRVADVDPRAMAVTVASMTDVNVDAD